MNQTLLLLGLLSLGAQAPTGAVQRPAKLKEERISIEYTVTSGEATLTAQAETELQLGDVVVSAPGGRPLMNLRAMPGQDRAMQGFVVEMKELELPELLQTYTAGIYRMRGRTVDGHPVTGSAVLSHALLPAPVVTYPLQDEVVETSFDVTWSPVPGARAYVIGLEQGDSDNLAASLPASQTVFSVPAGVLAPGRESHLEVAAVGANGNRTVVEVEFLTR